MNIRILIVDDEVQILKLLKQSLDGLGYEIETTEDPLQAMKMIESRNYHIVITDIAMPGMNGVDLIKKIKTYNGMIQIVMITGYTTTVNVLDSLRRGASDFFFKPFDDIYKVVDSINSIVERIKRWNFELEKIVLSSKQKK
ncbi:MAG: response regulator [Oligoflexia bacterium]|nr:response regulator [Oligoflexia bacterium]